ncbi:hypothetical protein J2T13_002642 [Paenibacillus sp. DS2015]
MKVRAAIKIDVKQQPGRNPGCLDYNGFKVSGEIELVYFSSRW